MLFHCCLEARIRGSTNICYHSLTEDGLFFSHATYSPGAAEEAGFISSGSVWLILAVTAPELKAVVLKRGLELD